MKPCDRGRGNSVVLIKAAVKVIQFITNSSVGSGSILGRRLIACQMFLELLVVRCSSSLSRYLALPVLMAFSAACLAFIYLSLSLSLYASYFACSLCLQVLNQGLSLE